MKNKRIICLIATLAVAASAIGVFLIERDITSNPNKKEVVVNNTKTSTSTKVSTKAENAVKTNLYSESAYYLPLEAIAEISELTPATKEKINKILDEAQGIYMLKQNPKTKEIIMVLQNPVSGTSGRYSRHDLQTAIIDSNGNVTYLTQGYNGQEYEVENTVVLKNDNENWVFDETAEPYKPLKHTVYDKKKKTKFAEEWHYDDSEPIKYEMKDGAGNVISVKKEYLDGESGYRQEHIFYDENGNTLKSMTINYDGADIKWFTYYDSSSPENSITIESIYDNGLKTEEKIYNQEYKTIKTLKSEYENGERTKLQVFDSEDKQINTYEN